MMEELKALTAARGISGEEDEICALLRQKCEDAGASCRTDRLGSLLCSKEGPDARAPRVLLCAHMDEEGFVVLGAREDGLLRIAPVGGIDPRVAVSKGVLCGEKQLPGVIGAKAIHLQSAADRARAPEFEKLFIDIGAKDQAEAERLCPMGTYCTFDSALFALGSCVAGRALDDRVGCFNLLRALRHGYAGQLTCAFTVQEEVGLRGATVLSRRLDYDVAIVAEATSANDLGNTVQATQVCTLGKGVVISHMDRASIAYRPLRDAVEQLAVRRGIPWQPKRTATGGNDAGPLQRGAGAKPTVVLSVPCRNVHSPNCVVSLDDIAAQGDLLCALLDELPALWMQIMKDEVTPQ